VKIIHLLIVAWLPGAVIFRLPFGGRDKRAALDAEERLFWAVIISLALSTSIVLALAAAERYTFERLLLADLGIAGGLALLGRFRLGLGTGARRAGLTVALPIALVLVGVWRFFPPSEYVIGGKDPGSYMNEGIQIAQRGTLEYHDPVVSSLPVSARPLFFPPHALTSVFSLRFMGFFVRNPDTGAVVGQFPHFFPASIAIGYGLDGLTGARRTVGVWAILGLLALYFVGARFVGRTAAGAAAMLLGLHVIQVWFSRYPNAEVVMQTLLFAALLATARAHVDDDAFFAPVAGALLGLLLFVRFDAVLGIGAVLAALALGVVVGGRIRATFLLTLALTSAIAAVYMLGVMRAYVDLPIIFISNLRPWHYALLALAGAAGIGAVAAGSRFPKVSDAVRRSVPTIVTLAVLGGAVYALYLREPVARVLAERDAYALRTFTNFYLTVPGLLAALVGFALLARRAFWRAPELFLTVAVYSFFFFYKVRIVSDHFWMTRRFLPVVLPGALLFAAGAALGGTRGSFWPVRAIRTTIGVVFLALLATYYARASRPILDHVEYAGVIPKLESIAASIGERDLLIVESREASDTHVLGVPLADIYARNVLVLASRRPDKALFAPFLEWARTHYARVLFMGGGGTDLLSPAWTANPIASDRFQIPEYDAPLDAYPRFARRKEFDYSLYELAPPDPEATARPIDLDIGVHDDLNVLRFHAKEETEGRTFRWSRDTSYVILNSLQESNREVILQLNNGGRPASVAPADLTVYLDNERLGHVQVGSGFRDYAMAIPPALAARLAARGQPVELMLTVSTWVPERVLGTPDPRPIGVMVDRVTVK
jgi:hypothetical protein